MGQQAFIPQAGNLGTALSKIGMSAQLSTHKYKHRPLDFVLQQELGRDTMMQVFLIISIIIIIYISHLQKQSMIPPGG